jgi:hypothetical protein
MPRDVDAELTPLPELLAALKDAGYVPADQDSEYRDCYTGAASARFPAQRIRGRWYVHPRDYPKIAAVLCPRRTSKPPANPPTRRARRAAAIAA